VKSVVIEDKLGICAELEAAMQRVIGTYECEWRKAVETPEIRRRFRHFVNSDKLDANIVLVEERGQRRPASDAEREHMKVSA
jgi:nitrite reductase (NADH) large subunit